MTETAHAICIKTAVWVDPAGSFLGGSETPEDQIEREKNLFEEELGVKLDIHAPRNIGEIEDGTDLVLFDYGGMVPGRSLAEDNSRRLVRWASDHPATLVIIISVFTYDRVFRNAIGKHLKDSVPPYFDSKPEGEKHRTPVHNIVIECWRENFIPEWFRDTHGCRPYRRNT